MYINYSWLHSPILGVYASRKNRDISLPLLQDEEIEAEHPNKSERKLSQPRKSASEPQLEKKESEKDAQEVAAQNKVRHLNSCMTSPPKGSTCWGRTWPSEKEGVCFAITGN